MNLILYFSRREKLLMLDSAIFLEADGIVLHIQNINII